MVAHSAPLPNIKKLFIPDPGYVICECDQDRADLQVVIAEADDDDLRDKCAAGVDLHTENAKDIFGITKVSPLQRFMAKPFVHGTNYGGKARTIGIACGLTTHEADKAQKRWFAAHRGILSWHRRTARSLQKHSAIWNKFGYRRRYFDRPEGLLPEALAWVPQSTVAIVTNKGIMNLTAEVPEIELLLQNHDSIVFQFPKKLIATGILLRIKSCLEISIPYPKPLTISIGLEMSSISWGDCIETDWNIRRIP